ncbi:hypothetical protein G4X40_04670 [Rhodococcus sp. D2-41]|uniref:Secreted protein n=1 Tax=Speluncibacter jeojiensis TaxID=2710754 RepID=A0A9X4M2N4_9ACTN|nr:hypothetical protein [Rhodococcus sp. D2-41]MDG3009437.1 hypothetical protein [Rhodococcus sp. D2-41]MDG3016935.1 hypothetical protein [Corynebacteriales bacterium D3-21]
MRKISGIRRPRRLSAKIAVASALAAAPMLAFAAPAFAATVPGTVQADQNWQGIQNHQNDRDHHGDHQGNQGPWQGPQNNGPAQWWQNNQGAPWQNNQGAPWQNNQGAPWQNLLPPNLQQPSTGNPLSGLFGSS